MVFLCVFPNSMDHKHHTNTIEKMRGIFNTQVIEKCRTCAMHFSPDTNSSNAPGDESPACNLLDRLLVFKNLAPLIASSNFQILKATCFSHCFFLSFSWFSLWSCALSFTLQGGDSCIVYSLHMAFQLRVGPDSSI